jgi:PIN domain nuclease of toxin-antitoxin system
MTPKSRILIDTHILLWYLNGDQKLSLEKREILQNIDNDIFVSCMSLWEISIKVSLKKLKIDYTISQLEQWIRMMQFTLLPIHPKTLDALKVLPFLHRDPFDRYLVAEAQTHHFHLYSEDQQIQRYFENPIDSLPNPIP